MNSSKFHSPLKFINILFEIILNIKKLRIYFIGCNVNMYGIPTPNLKLPFKVHHNKYKERNENVTVGKRVKPVSSKTIKKSFKNGYFYIITNTILKISKKLFKKYSVILYILHVDDPNK
jgi:hypothetical protein